MPAFERVYREVSQQIGNRARFAPLVVHEILLADRARVEAYRRAIERYVQPGDTVLDLGTGSGILAFLAARRGAKKVIAIDHAGVIDAARLVAHENGLSNIEFIERHSKDLELDERVDVIVHEQIGAHVFDEHVVANLVDARERLLKPSGVILPSRFEISFEPVSMRDEHRTPFIWEQRIDGVDFACLRDLTDPEDDLMSVMPDQIGARLCEAEVALRFDLATVEESKLPRVVTFERKVVRSGRLDGVALFFRARFDDDIALGTRDGATNWQVPLWRVPARECRVGENLCVKIAMAEIAVPRTWQVACEVG